MSDINQQLRSATVSVITPQTSAKIYGTTPPTDAVYPYITTSIIDSRVAAKGIDIHQTTVEFVAVNVFREHAHREAIDNIGSVLHAHLTAANITTYLLSGWRCEAVRFVSSTERTQYTDSVTILSRVFRFNFLINS